MTSSQKISDLAVKAVEARKEWDTCNWHSEPEKNLSLRMSYAHAESVALRNEVEALRAALKPFADVFNEITSGYKKADSAALLKEVHLAFGALTADGAEVYIDIKGDDLRRAAEALKHQRPTD